MQNPFVYGEIVPGEAFVDREVELDRLINDLAGGQKVFLISPRRYGKSSLVRQALAALDTKWDRARQWFMDAIRSTRPELRYEPKDTGLGRFSVAFPLARTDRDVTRLANEVFALPGQLADARKRTVVVALDEFQAVVGFDGGSVEQALRAAVQQQRRVGYVFAGSEPSLMEQMIGPKRPFYKAGPVMRLQKIPAATFAAFVDRRFTRSGLTPEAGLGAAVVDLAGNLPYDVQRLAHETWDDVTADRRKRATLDDLHVTLNRLLAEHDTMLETVWQRLTLAQRAALRAVVFEQGE